VSVFRLERSADDAEITLEEPLPEGLRVVRDLIKSGYLIPA
jgi:hypothetical protein